MMKRLALLFAALALSACSVLPKSAPQPAQHDLGSDFAPPIGRAALPLRNVTVSAAPVVGGLSMYYREAATPTRRGVYAYNRWAAPPASLVENALVRLLPFEASGRCRLLVQLSDLIVETTAQGSGSVLLAAELRLAADGRIEVMQRVNDVRVPLTMVDPAAAAQAAHDAVVRLGEDASTWITTEAAAFCRS